MPFPSRVVTERTDIADVFQENTQNILQKTSVSNMIGLLGQLNKISVYASEVFEDILQTTQSNNTRIKQCKQRLHSIQAKVPSTERMFIDNAPSYFYDNPYTGKEWQRKDPLRGLLFRRDRATKQVNQRREEGLPLPDLSPLDRISASGPCVKKFSDSNFFMNEWLEAEKRKMEEEKLKRKERKKKRKKQKRQEHKKIVGIVKDVYDPVTGKKIKATESEIITKQYTLSGDVAANMDFESQGDGGSKYSKRMSGMQTSKKSKVAQMASRKKKSKQHDKKPSTNLSIDPLQQQQLSSYAVIPGMDAIPAGGGGPPPNPMQQGPGGGGPPPNPMMQQPGGGGPPPVPSAAVPPPNPMMMQPAKPKLTPAQRAAMSAQAASQNDMYSKPVQKKPPHPLFAMKSNALLDGIKNRNVKLKRTEQVKREPQQDQRSMLMMALKKKSQSGGLKHVTDEQKNQKKEEEMESTIYAILNRRKYMADSSGSDSGSGSGWSESD